MGTFSNGTEGMQYEEQWCARCRHVGDEDTGCPVMNAHVLYAYEMSHDSDSPCKVVLDMLIPLGDDRCNEQCAMFVEAPPGVQGELAL